VYRLYDFVYDEARVMELGVPMERAECEGIWGDRKVRENDRTKV
jgi:hypothetical protein